MLRHVARPLLGAMRLLPARTSRSGARGLAAGLTTGLAAATATATQSAPATTPPSVLTYAQLEDLTLDVAEHPLVRVMMPLMPESLKVVLVGKVVSAIAAQLDATDLDPRTREQIALAADGLSEGVSHETVERLAEHVDASIDLPFVSKEQTRALVRTVASLMLGDASLSVRENTISTVGERKARLHSFVEALRDPEARRALATRLNAKVDLPFLSEEQEQRAFEKLVDVLGGTLGRLIPPEVLETLRGLSAEEIGGFKEMAVRRLEETLSAAPLPLVPADAKSAAVRAFVDFAVDFVVEGTEVGHAVLAPAEQLERLRRQERSMRDEYPAIERRAERQRRELRRRMKRNELQKIQAKKELAARTSKGGWW